MPKLANQQNSYSERLLDLEFEIPPNDSNLCAGSHEKATNDPFSQAKNCSNLRNPRNSHLAGAAFFVLLAIATWISEIELTRYILNAKDSKGGFNNPYAIIWMSHNLYIPFGFGMSFILRLFRGKNGPQDGFDLSPFEGGIKKEYIVRL